MAAWSPVRPLGAAFGILESREYKVLFRARTENSSSEVSEGFFERSSSVLIGTYIGFPLTDFDQILM